MIHPKKWRETADPFALPYRAFRLERVLGYPHAGNDVFQVEGVWRGRRVEAFVKVARQSGADIANEIAVIETLSCALAPEIIDCDERHELFEVTLARPGERLSTLLGRNERRESLGYMYEYGRALAGLHAASGYFRAVRDRRFFHIPERERLEANGLGYVYDYLIRHEPQATVSCFCHGDFHYANLLWQDGHISGILDFELSGVGNRDFDIAWAVILRPGQRFLNTPEELELFLNGYESAGRCNRCNVRYYMALIYSRFYDIGRDEPGYREYVARWLRQSCSR